MEDPSPAPPRDDPNAIPIEQRLTAFAAFRSLPAAVRHLAHAAHHENWGEHDFFLDKYLRHIFYRQSQLQHIYVSPLDTFAAFHTGLFESSPVRAPIYAYFLLNEFRSRSVLVPGLPLPPPFRFHCFCSEMSVARDERHAFQVMVRETRDFLRHLPAPPVFDPIAFDPGLPVVPVASHILKDRFFRFPASFLMRHLANHERASNLLCMAVDLPLQNRTPALRNLSALLHVDDRAFLLLRDAFQRHLDDSVGRWQQNPSLAIPAYFPRLDAMQLLMPLFLDTDPAAPPSLAILLTPRNGTYSAPTILPLDRAATNARLVAPQATWLARHRVSAPSAPQPLGLGL